MITLKIKLEVIKRLEYSEGILALSFMYDISESNVWLIRKNADEVKSSLKSSPFLAKITSGSPLEEPTTSLLIATWLLSADALDVPTPSYPQDSL